MHIAFLIIFPLLAGFLVSWSGRWLLGDTNTTMIATLSMCAAIGVGFAVSVIN